MTNRLKEVLPLLLALVVFALCSVLPRILVPISAEITAEVTTPEQRQILWREFWSEREGQGQYAGATLELNGDRRACMQTVDSALRKFRVDTREVDVVAEGMEEIVYTGSVGTLKLFHYYREWTGDWSNWLDIYVDLDSREIYYMYISSGCQNEEAGAEEAVFSAQDTSGIALIWGDHLGVDSIGCAWSGEMGEPAIAGYRGLESWLVYEIKYTYHKAALYDLKITMQ